MIGGLEIMPLDHSKLTVYREALELLSIIDEIIGLLPVGSGTLRDQLDRAAMSIITNIAEGAGESASEKKRFYWDARRSVNELAAWLDILARRQQITPELHASADARMTAIVSMLEAEGSI